MMFCLVFFLNILLCQIVLSINWEHKIYVSTTTGINDTTCWTNGQHTPCASINLALKGLQNNSTVIYITPGIYTLEYGRETQVTKKSQVAFIGIVPDSPGEQQRVVIKCSSLTGLSFLWSANIIFQSLTLHGCGGIQVSTSRNLSSQSFELLMFQVAMYMLYCQNVHIVDVVIESSNGTGLTIYNTAGNVTISGCVFKENGVGILYGGGGLQIEWSYCNPENERNCPEKGPSPVDDNNDSLYNIINCNFTFNMAQGGSLLSHYYRLSNQGRDSYVLGRGGGVSVIFKGQASNSKIIMNYNMLVGNQADHGGGFFIGYYDDVSNNSVEIGHMTVANNSNTNIDEVGFIEDRGGGGGKIEVYANVFKQLVNYVELFQSSVLRNIGIVGGGLSIETTSTINVYISEVNFTTNTAYLGSACYFTNGIDLNQHVFTLTNCTFTDNTPVCDNIDAEYTLATLPCSGTLYSNSVPISFSGINIFNDNKASAIEVHGSVITINPSTEMRFTGNNWSYGGAIALYDCSYIVLYNETKLTFSNNTANTQGGAIYSGFCSRQISSYFQHSVCFIVYYDPDIHPDEWETKLVFSLNKVINIYAAVFNCHSYQYEKPHKPNAVYATSLSSCWWPLLSNTTSVTLSSINRTLCWNNWNYTSDNCATSIQSGVAFLNVSLVEQQQLSIFSGSKLNLSVIAYDGTGHPLLSNTSIIKCVNSEDNVVYFNHNQPCTVDDFPFIQGNGTFNLSIIANIESSQLKVVTRMYTLKSCQWPFVLKDNICTINVDGFCCKFGDCVNSVRMNGFYCKLGDCEECENCTVGSYYYGTLLGYCLSNYNSQPVIGKCPVQLDVYFYLCSGYTYSTFISKALSSIKYSRYTGRLNGACKNENFCVPINSPYLQCTSNEYGYINGLLIFFFVQMFSVTLIVILIIVLNIKFTNGSLNGYIFYCQIVSLSFPANYYSSYLYLLSPCGIWNLDFLTAFIFYPVCISSTMGSLGAIAFWYVIAAFPFFLLFFFYGWITMYNKGFKCVVTLTRPLHRFLARFWRMTNIQPSFTHSISSIYVLCFTQFAATSLKLLHFTKWYSLTNEYETGIAFYYDGTLNYFGYPHAFLGILAIIILIVVVFIPTAYLLLHPFKWFHKILDWCKLKRPQFVITLVDDYTGAFKNGCDNTNDYRYFAGLYLLLRVIIMSQYYIPIEHYRIILSIQTSLYGMAGGSIMIFRPYRKNIHNFTEFLMFSILALMSGINLFSDIAFLFLIYLPPGIVFIYCIYWIIKKFASCCFYCRPTKQKQTETTEVYVSSLDVNDTFADRVMNPDKYDEHHVSTVQSDCESPPAEIEPFTTHYQEMTHHISINPVSTTSTRSRHSGDNKSSNTSNSSALTRLLLNEDEL